MHSPEVYLDDLFSFITSSPTPYHAAHTCAALLEQHGFRLLKERDPWSSLDRGRYYLLRDDAALIAFTLAGPLSQGRPLRMAGAHTDSPALRVKPRPMQVNQGCAQLGVEVYGGPLLTSWFDRDLSLAGRVSWRAGEGPLQCSLIDFCRPMAVIPSLAIHLDREADKGRAINRQTDLLPLLLQTDEADPPDFPALLHNQLRRQYPAIGEAEILDWDLFLYDPHPPARIGAPGNLITGPRLDNLLSCHALIQALVHAGEPLRDALVILNNHEEVGSLSDSGAQGTLLRALLERLWPEPENRNRMLAGSLFVSVDNAHAVHPNFAGKHDANHLPRLNHGPVIKTNAGQRYATSGATAALFRLLCRQANVPCQDFAMRNDQPCGSTIGPLTAATIGIAAVDVGVPQLAMHSIRETAGVLDSWHLFQVLRCFFVAADEAIFRPAACCQPL